MSAISRRRAAGTSLFACLLIGALAAPAGVAARDPQVTGFPPRVSGLPARPDAAPSPIVVTTVADATANDGACSLREAITAAIANAPGPDSTGRCRAGTIDDVDMIEFATGGTITLASDLPEITDWILIDGSTAPSPITIDGVDLHHPFTVDDEGSLDLMDLTVTNGATDNAGGAILNRGFVSLLGVTVSSSAATLAGGAVSGTTGSFTWIEGSRITGNATGGYGGGIRSAGFTIVFDSVVSDNSAVGAGGGAAFLGDDGAMVYGSTFADNVATGPAAGGGAIHNDGVLDVANSTFAGNAAAAGGGIRDTGTMELDHVTITANAAAAGSGVSSTKSPVLVNTIVLGNLGPDPELDATPGAGSSHNLLALPGGVTLAQVLDPAGDADNGGPTPTVALVRDAANPAWNGGSQSLCEDLGLTADQRGFERSDPCDIGAFEIDDLAPAVGAPTLTLPQGSTLAGSSLAGRVSWSASDLGSGVSGHELEVRVNGAAFTPVVIDPTAAATTYALANGASYQFRARSVDAEGNWSAWKTGPSVSAKLVQQTASSVTFSSGWKGTTASAYSGGSAKYASKKGATVTFKATGRVFSFITTKGPSRGKAKVYVDGKYVVTIDLKAATTTYRVQAWTKTFSSAKSHTIKIVVLGTSGRPRVYADAFAVIR